MGGLSGVWHPRRLCRLILSTEAGVNAQGSASQLALLHNLVASGGAALAAEKEDRAGLAARLAALISSLLTILRAPRPESAAVDVGMEESDGWGGEAPPYFPTRPISTAGTITSSSAVASSSTNGSAAASTSSAAGGAAKSPGWHAPRISSGGAGWMDIDSGEGAGQRPPVPPETADNTAQLVALCSSPQFDALLRALVEAVLPHAAMLAPGTPPSTAPQVRRD